MLVSLMRPLRRLFQACVLAPFAAAALGIGGALAQPQDLAPDITPLPGAEIEPFQQALADWLADDEAAALPVLAALASEGNIAARLLLGLIDKVPALQGPYLHHLDRADRIALLRAPGGLSGRNWLTEARDHPLAATWRRLWAVDADASVIARFAAMGETVAARTALTVLAARESPSLSTLDPATTDPELLYLLWIAAGPERRATIERHVPAQHPQRALMGERLDARDLNLWLDAASAALPLATLCAAVCPDAQSACRLAAYRALDSHNALLTLGTPAEALVPQRAFLDTPRGRASVMRRILLATPLRGRRAMLARTAQDCPCLGAALTAENERYRRASPILIEPAE